MKFHAKSVGEVLQHFSVAPEAGLTANEAEIRLAEYGPNRLETQRKKTAIQLLVAQFNSLLVWILLASAAVSGFVLHELVDALVILAVVFVNAAIGFYQEFEAESAIEKLQDMSQPKVRVLREGKVVLHESTGLVPGDVMLLEAGNIVSADARLIEAENLQTQEAALTGESLPVDKLADFTCPESASIGDRDNMVFSGTNISNGRAKAIVTQTGLSTELGQIARLLSEQGEEPTLLQKQINRLSKQLIAASLLLIVLITLVGYFMLQLSYQELFLYAISLVIAAIPEGLPALLTISLAIGAKRMLHKNALIRRLPAVETLGSVTTICTDKTGTLTCNKMVVEKTEALDADNLHLGLALCNDVIVQDGEFLGEPTEVALVEYADRLGFDKDRLEREYPRVAEIPFNSTRKSMTTVHRTPLGGFIALTKGAPEAVASAAEGFPLHDLADQWAAEGIRVLAFASKPLQDASADNADKGVLTAGLVGMIDPLRAETPAAVSDCLDSKIRVVMVTGDHPRIAEYIGKKLHIDNNLPAVTGQQFEAATDTYDIHRHNLYARVSPKNKLTLVENLKKANRIVAMTGDGVNDAPALKAADIGIAMGRSGSDVARQTSDIVLLDDRFSTIVEAVRQGRILFDNLVRFIRYMLTTNLAEVMTMLFAPLLGMPLPLVPVQILWMNLVTDGLPALALGVEPAESDVMRKPPRTPHAPILTAPILFRILSLGAVMTVLALSIDSNREESVWRTMVFTTLVFSQFALAYSERSLTDFVFLKKSFNPALVISLMITTALQFAIVYTPFGNQTFQTTNLSATELGHCALLALIVFVVAELQKRMPFFRKKSSA